MKILKLVLLSTLLLTITLIIVFSQKDIPLNELKEKYTNSYSSFIDIGGTNVHYRAGTMNKYNWN